MILTAEIREIITALKQGAKLVAAQDTKGKATIVKKVVLTKNYYGVGGKPQSQEVSLSMFYRLKKAGYLKEGAFPWQYELTKKGIEA